MAGLNNEPVPNVGIVLPILLLQPIYPYVPAVTNVLFLLLANIILLLPDITIEPVKLLVNVPEPDTDVSVLNNILVCESGLELDI